MAKSPIMKRIDAARRDRDNHQGWMNDILKLSMPTYRQIGESIEPEGRFREQDDLFDTTLQEVVEDFASDMIATFTPRHERWVKFQPYDSLLEEEKKSISGDLRALEDAIFDEIERSNYWDAAQECFGFWGVGCMAVAISDMGPLQPLHFQPIELADLLIERGADGSTTGRWREMKLTKAGLHQLWPTVFPPPSMKDSTNPKTYCVHDGCDRDYSVPGEERWTYRVLVDGEEKFSSTEAGAGSAPIVVCRFRHQADSAWGPGPAHKAAPMARVLDELAYLQLKALQKSVDPIVSYEEDGVMNIEGGLDPGSWLARAPNSKAPEPLEPNIRFDVTIFKADELRKGIKKAMYQDRPEQPGQTPPTATQWFDEKTWNTRRKELPRDRCVREWVLPIIERVAWIKAQRGELPEIRLKDGKLINVRPISPLSKAKDLEDVQVTGQVLALAGQVATAKASGVAINDRETIAKIAKTAGERHIVMLTDEEIQQQMMMAAAAQGGAGAPEVL